MDLPPIRPIVTPCCRKAVGAPAPEGFEPGSPFGPGIGALILHLHITQAVSFERLSRLMAEVFGLSISEGAIATILARAEAPLVAAADTITAAVRASPQDSPHFYTTSNTSVNSAIPASISANLSISGRSRYSVMFGMS
jgi:hypothetical protein